MIGIRARARALATMAAAAMVTAVVGCLPVAPAPSPGDQTPRPVGRPTVEAGSVSAGSTWRPNIILITADDATTYDLDAMPLTRALLADHGLAFTEAVSPHPLCCPARAQLLTGQYAQNNGVHHNSGPFGGFKALDPSSTVATWLGAAGYRTAFVGKYLNEYTSTDRRQPGWTWWDPLVRGIYDYGDFTFWNNDRRRMAAYSDSYVTDILTDRAVRIVGRFARSGDPFFVWVSHVAPHDAFELDTGLWGTPVPARRHEDLFADARPPSLDKPSFNEPDVSDQPADLATKAPVNPRVVVHSYRERSRSLVAVDESVAAVVRRLRSIGELRNTFIIFTSDNGFALGEHRWIGKDRLTDEILRVPLLVRGPGVQAGGRSDRRVALVDLPVTIAGIAAARPGIRVDGQSFLPTLRSRPQAWRDTQLVLTGDETRPWTWRGVRTARYTYARNWQSGERALYDRKLDPFEVDNVAADPAYSAIMRELARRLALLRDCSGAGCVLRLGPVPGPSA